MNYRIKPILALLSLLGSCSAFAAVSAEEAKQLGTTLMPWGAEKAGNKEGTIPAYTGGLTTPPASFDPNNRKVLPDPYASEKPLFTIDAKNMAQHADKLSEGVKAMLTKYPGYRISIYPSHRSAKYPKEVQDASIVNATRCKLVGLQLDDDNCRGGVPFPIPKTGAEPLWNKQLYYHTPYAYVPGTGSYVIDASGRVTLMNVNDYHTEIPYYSKPDSKNKADRFYYKWRGISPEPPRAAGEGIIMTCPVDTSLGCYFWQYLPGQRRVKLSPDLAHDTPNPQSAGSSLMDEIYGWLGPMERYDWKLIGKKEMYIPYNAYKLMACGAAGTLFLKNHLNPDCERWELHRVWVVEANLKQGMRHAYHKRMFYLDEDVFIGLYDNYDASGKLHRINYQEPVPLYYEKSWGTWGHPFQTFDLQTGIYSAYDNAVPGLWLWPIPKRLTDREWTPESLAGSGVR